MLYTPILEPQNTLKHFLSHNTIPVAEALFLSTAFRCLLPRPRLYTNVPSRGVVLIAQGLGEEALTLADALRGVDEDMADAVFQVSKHFSLAGWEASHELACRVQTPDLSGID